MPYFFTFVYRISIEKILGFGLFRLKSPNFLLSYGDLELF